MCSRIYVLEEMEEETVDDATFERWKLALRKNRCELIEKMQPTVPLYSKLEELAVINRFTKQRLMAERTDYEKNSAFLDYLCTRPKEDFVRLREALVYDNQASILDILNR